VIKSLLSSSVYFYPTRQQKPSLKRKQLSFGGWATLAGTMAGSNYYLLSSQPPKPNLQLNLRPDNSKIVPHAVSSLGRRV
jgi:hypothetical protein